MSNAQRGLVTPRILMALILLLLGGTVLLDWPDITVFRPELGNAEEDVASAVAIRDFSLRGVLGFAVAVPGIDGDYEILRTKFDVVVIEGTSDVVVLDPRSFNSRADRYAFAYNRSMFDRLGCDFRTPMAKCTSYP